ncbi:class I SAM-dependent methyltransferase [Devosia sp. ZW T5_3]|uniref:class I SAM-dependent methyltransferase n=1 Tax=Devosia sp. ZW T5_3 TaxID=3378085 RepID=UPI0038536825
MSGADKLNPQRRAAIKMLSKLPRGGSAAEIGVYRGDFSEMILRTVRPKSLTLVDPWQWREQWFAQHESNEIAAIAEGEATAEGEAIYQSVVTRFRDASAVHIVREASHRACLGASDCSLDWVFIDGDHRYAPALGDLRDWWPKVKPGGWICGDDYDLQPPPFSQRDENPNGVFWAVNEFARENTLELSLIPWGEGDMRAHYMIRKPIARRFGMLSKWR